MFVYSRVLGRTDPTVSTAIWYNSTGVVLAWIITFSFDGFDSLQQLPFMTPLYLLMALGVFASFQQFSLAQSHMYAQASILTPSHFLAIPLGIAIGIMFFNESITLKFLMGTAIIIASTYYIVMRKQAK